MKFIKFMRNYMIICDFFQIYETLWGTYENLLKPMKIYMIIYEIYELYEI